jgi:hypothetical protein
MNNINWNLVRMTVGEKIDDLKAEIMYCGCTEHNNYKVPKLKRLLALYEEEYKKLMILQQEPNKCICQELKEKKEVYLSDKGIEPEVKIYFDKGKYYLEACDYNSTFIQIDYCPICGHKLGED